MIESYHVSAQRNHILEEPTLANLNSPNKDPQIVSRKPALQALGVASMTK
jgi:hypothetical protein